MTKNKFLRNMIVIAISLAAVTAFSSCNKDDDDKKNNGNNPGGVPATLPTQQQLNAVGISTALPEMTGTLVGSDYSEGITLKWSNSGERSSDKNSSNGSIYSRADVSETSRPSSNVWMRTCCTPSALARVTIAFR